LQAEKDTFITGFEPTTVSVDETVNIIIELDDSNALNRPPTVAILDSPADNSTNLGIEVTLSWIAAVDPDADAILYDIEVRNDLNNDVLTYADITETTYQLDGLAYGVKYFWQVIASDGINSDVISATFTFETSDFPNNRYLYVREESGNNVIYSSNELGEDIAITSVNDNSWRPRKNNIIQKIAFLKTHNSETHLFTMNVDGSNQQQVTSTVQPAGFKQSEIDFSWATNGSRLLYANFNKLYVINQDGSGNQLVYQTTDGSFISECDWSNDGSIVALKTNNSSGYNIKIFTIDMAGTELVTVLSGINGAVGGINLSVNNEKLLYTRDISAFENDSYRQLNTHAFIYVFNTLIHHDYSLYKTNGTNDLDVRFSPNEAQILVVNTSNDGISIKNIETINIDDYEVRNELFTNAMMPDWE
ncbi:MAG: hypothetical protein V3U80_04585, partial [Flavobacteriaceae bacterium]